MPTIRATKRNSGIELVINTDHITYAEPNGDGASTNIYLINRETLQVTESLDVVEERMNTSTTLDVIRDVFDATTEFSESASQELVDALNQEGNRDEGNPQEREITGGNKGKGKGKDKEPEAPETKPAAAPETKAETEAGAS